MREKLRSYSLAKEARVTTVIIDEKRGRRVAKSLGLRVRGTLGILLELKKRGTDKASKTCHR